MKKSVFLKLYIAGFCAESYAGERLVKGKGQILSRFSKAFINEGLGDIITEEELIGRYFSKHGQPAGTVFCAELGEAGAFGGLWQLGEVLKCGLKAELNKIPIRQPAIEVCEFYDVNPYMQDSKSAWLIAAPADDVFWEELKSAGIPISEIGYTTTDNDRLVINGEEKRFITKV